MSILWLASLSSLLLAFVHCDSNFKVDGDVKVEPVFIPLKFLDENLPDGDHVASNRRLLKQWKCRTSEVALPEGMGLFVESGDKELVTSEYFPVPPVPPHTTFTMQVELLTGSSLGLKEIHFRLRNKNGTAFSGFMWSQLRVVDDDTLNKDTPVELSEQDVYDLWDVIPVPREDARGLSVAQYIEKYGQPQTPVILQGIWSDENRSKFTFTNINKTCGEEMAHTVRASSFPRQDCEWANLCEESPSLISYFIQKYVVEGQTHSSLYDMKYINDVSLARKCPDLAPFYQVSEFFVEDFMAVLNMSDNWPSMFLGPGGSVTDFHSDAKGSAFTMALAVGRKQWLLTSPEGFKNISHYDHSINATVFIHGFAPDFEAYPLAKGTPMYGATLEEGEIFVVPGNWPHAVRNLGPTIGLSRNYVGQSELPAVLDDCQQTFDHPAVGPQMISAGKKILCLMGEILLRHGFSTDNPGPLSDWEAVHGWLRPKVDTFIADLYALGKLGGLDKESVVMIDSYYEAYKGWQREEERYRKAAEKKKQEKTLAGKKLTIENSKVDLDRGHGEL